MSERVLSGAPASPGLAIGHQDPGATSAALIMAALQQAVERES